MSQETHTYSFADSPISGTLKSQVEGKVEAFDYQKRKLKNGLEEDLQKLVKDQKGKFLSYIRFSFHETADLSLELTLKIYDSGNSVKHLLLFVSKDNGEFAWINPIEETFSESENSIHFSIPSQLPQKEALSEANFSGDSNEIIIRPIFFKGIKDEDKTGLLTKDYKLMYVDYEGPKRKFRELTEGSDMWKRVFPHTSHDFPKDPQAHMRSRELEPTLLLIHGTNGTAKVAYQGMIDDDDTYDSLYQKYGDRIFAFQHPSIFHGIGLNVNKLCDYLENIPIGPIDIITRSRGALVARWLLEVCDFNEKPGFNYIRRVVMIAPPNQGSHSATGLGNKWRTSVYVTPMLRTLDRELGPKSKDMPSLLERKEEILEHMEIDLVKLLHLLGRNKGMQGAKDMDINGNVISVLNNSDNKKQKLPSYYSIAGQLNLSDEVWGPRTDEQKTHLYNLRQLLRRTFETEEMDKSSGNKRKKAVENDGINPTYGAFGTMTPDESSRINLQYESVYMLKNSEHAHHLNYMNFSEVRQAILYYLDALDPEMPLSPEIASISGVLEDQHIDKKLS